MSGPVRVHDHDLEVGVVEGQVVVAPVPHEHVRLRLGLPEDVLVVHA